MVQSIALNMLAGIAITAAISAVISGIDNLVHRTEKIKEAAAEAQNAIKNAQDTLKTMSDTIAENKDRFLELSEGVDKFSHNLKLSEDEKHGEKRQRCRRTCQTDCGKEKQQKGCRR